MLNKNLKIQIMLNKVEKDILLKISKKEKQSVSKIVNNLILEAIELRKNIAQGKN